MPEGHVPINRFLTVPIVFRGNAIGIFGVSGKETDFNEEDRELLEKITLHIAPILYARLQRDKEEKARRQAEEAIRNSERRMADIINFLPDATFVIDTNGTVIAWNRAIENLLASKPTISWVNAITNMHCPFTVGETSHSDRLGIAGR